MWSFIFNDKKIKGRPRILEISDSDYDYESIYYKIHNDPKYDSEDKKAINDAIYNAYQKLDDTIRKVTDGNHPLSIHPVNEMIDLFSDRKGGSGYFFTLNQDLFIERRYKLREPLTHLLPNACRINLVGGRTKRPLENGDFKTLPSEEELDKEKTQLLKESGLRYIKLHGSFNWYSFDGSEISQPLYSPLTLILHCFINTAYLGNSNTAPINKPIYSCNSIIYLSILTRKLY
jgi:hypothetical protein